MHTIPSCYSPIVWLTASEDRIPPAPRRLITMRSLLLHRRLPTQFLDQRIAGNHEYRHGRQHVLLSHNII